LVSTNAAERRFSSEEKKMTSMMTPIEKLDAAGTRLAKAQDKVSKANWPADLRDLLAARAKAWEDLNTLSSGVFERLQRDTQGGFKGDDWETLANAARLDSEAQYLEHLLEMLPQD
jgi:hypothetical protein